jgi:hypothetical protein
MIDFSLTSVTKIEVVPFIINFSTDLTTVVKGVGMIRAEIGLNEIYSVSAEKIINDGFSYSENV